MSFDDPDSSGLMGLFIREEGQMTAGLSSRKRGLESTRLSFSSPLPHTERETGPGDGDTMVFGTVSAALRVRAHHALLRGGGERAGRGFGLTFCRRGFSGVLNVALNLAAT